MMKGRLKAIVAAKVVPTVAKTEKMDLAKVVKFQKSKRTLEREAQAQVIAERLDKIVGEQVLMAGILGPDSDIVLSVEQTRARVEEVARTLPPDDVAIYLVNAGQMEANEVSTAVEDVPALAKRAAAAVDYSSLEAVMGGGSMLEAFYPAVEASEDGDGSRPGSAMSPMNRTMTGARLLYSPRAVPSWQAGLGLTAGGAKPPPRRQGASARVKPASSVDKAVDRLTTDGFSAKKTLSPVRSKRQQPDLCTTN